MSRHIRKCQKLSEFDATGSTAVDSECAVLVSVGAAAVLRGTTVKKKPAADEGCRAAARRSLRQMKSAVRQGGSPVRQFDWKMRKKFDFCEF